MNWTRDCAAIIPCSNEEGMIRRVVRGVRDHLKTVIVVDDGSTDGTAAQAALAGADILVHPGNLGKGAALQSGFGHARSLGFTWALTLDGDGQHQPSDIPALIAKVEESKADLVIGNRLIHREPMPWLRRHVNHWMSRRLSHLAGLPLADSQCGLRLVNLDAWSKLQLKTLHFEFESELLVEFVRAGHKVEFVPAQVIYNSRQSHIRPLVDSFRWFRWWFRQYPSTVRDKSLQEWPSTCLSGLQHDSRSVRQFDLCASQTGLESETLQFRQAKPALD